MEIPKDLLKGFSGKEGAKEKTLEAVEKSFRLSLPYDYKEFIAQFNGGEGFFGEKQEYLVLWAAEELFQFNKEYEVQVYAPGLLLFGGNGGGEGFAFDTRKKEFSIVMVPLIGMELQYANPIAKNFTEFLSKLGQ